MAKDAYSNPTRVATTSYQDLTKGSAERAERAVAQIQAAVIRKRNQQQTLYEEQLRVDARKGEQVQQLSNTGVASFDNNLRDFWNGKIDDYYEIKNNMSTGDIDKQDGQRALALLNQELSLWKNSQMDILTLARQLNETNKKYEAGKANGISSVTPQGFQQVLGDLANEKNVMLKDDEYGEMYLVSVDDEGNTIKIGDQEAMINVKELLKLQASKSLITYVPDTHKHDVKVVDKFLNPNNTQSAYVTFENEPTPTDKDPNSENNDIYRFITPQKQSALKQQMYDAGAYKEFVSDNSLMKPLWADVYGKMLEKENRSVENSAVADVIARNILPNTADADGDYNNIEKAVILENLDLLIANTEWGPGNIPDDFTGNAQDWLEMQKEVAQVLMINRSVDERVAELGLSERKYVKTEKKPKSGTQYTRQVFETRGNDINLINNAISDGIKDDNSMLQALNNAAGKESYKIKNGKIVNNRGESIIYDLNNKQSLAYAIGEAAGINKDVMAYSLLPRNQKPKK